MNFPLYSLRDCISSFAVAHKTYFQLASGERKVHARSVCVPRARVTTLGS
jgi:hypothetical protein